MSVMRGACVCCMEGRGRQWPLELMPGFYIASRQGIRGGAVTWKQMERHLDVRTLGYQYRADSLWVLFGKLGLDDLHRIREFQGSGDDDTGKVHSLRSTTPTVQACVIPLVPPTVERPHATPLPVIP